MKDLWGNTITKDLYELPIEFKFSNHNDLRTSPTLSNSKSHDYNFNIFSPIKSPLDEKETSRKVKALEEVNQNTTAEAVTQKQSKACSASNGKNEPAAKFSTKIVLNDYTEYILKKRDTLSPGSNTDAADSTNTARANFRKQIGRVKYYWRGTNFNYPFTFMKIFTLKGPEDSKCSIFSDCGDDYIFCVEDLSKKKINPTEFFYR